MGSPIQNAVEGGDLLSRLFWQGLLVGGPPAWGSRGPAATFSSAGDDDDDSPGQGSPRVESNGLPGLSGDGWKNPHWDDDVTSLPTVASLPPVTSLDLSVNSLDPVPVIANPEPASIFLLASGSRGGLSSHTHHHIAKSWQRLFCHNGLWMLIALPSSARHRSSNRSPPVGA